MKWSNNYMDKKKTYTLRDIVDEMALFVGTEEYYKSFLVLSDFIEYLEEKEKKSNG